MTTKWGNNFPFSLLIGLRVVCEAPVTGNLQKKHRLLRKQA